MPIFNVQLVADSLARLRALDELGLDLKQRAARQEERNRFIVPGILNDDQIKKATAAGYEVHIIDDLTKVSEAKKQEVSRENRFLTARSAMEMAPRTEEGYLTPEEVEEALSNLSRENTGLVKLIELPNRSWEDRVTHAVRVGLTQDADQPTVLFTGSMHAREWGGSDICISFLVNLIKAYHKKDPLPYGGKVFSSKQIRSIIENLNIIVFPDVNPDGKHYSQNVFPMWRKNRNPNNTDDPENQGVDLNRNFDFLWKSGIGTSDELSSAVYKGKKAFSEPETRNVFHLFEKHPGILYYVDIHSYSELVLYSWGDDDNQSSDPGQNFANPTYDGARGKLEDLKYREFITPLDEIIAIGLANRMNNALAAVRGTPGYTVQESSGLYPTTGTSTDYAFGRSLTDKKPSKIQGWTIEFGKEFIPPFGEMRHIIKEVGAAMTELCWSVSV